jgi:hypothetical protein
MAVYKHVGLLLGPLTDCTSAIPTDALSRTRIPIPNKIRLMVGLPITPVPMTGVGVCDRSESLGSALLNKTRDLSILFPPPRKKLA